MRINLWTVSEGPPRKVVGPELITNLFLPNLLRSIVLEEYARVSAFVEHVAATYTELPKAQEAIRKKVPDTLSAAERETFDKELLEKASIVSAFSHYLRFVGTKTFLRDFPRGLDRSRTSRRWTTTAPIVLGETLLDSPADGRAGGGFEAIAEDVITNTPVVATPGNDA